MLNVEFIENKEELAVVLERVIGHCYHGIPEYQIEEAFEEVIEDKLHRQFQYGKELTLLELGDEDEETLGCDFIDEEGLCIRDGDAFYCEEKIHCSLKLFGYDL